MAETLKLRSEVFLDAAYAIALAAPNDQHHQRDAGTWFNPGFDARRAFSAGRFSGIAAHACLSVGDENFLTYLFHPSSFILHPSRAVP